MLGLLPLTYYTSPLVEGVVRQRMRAHLASPFWAFCSKRLS